MAQLKKSSQLIDDAKKWIPGGVNSPVRAFQSVGGTPIFIQKGKGARFTDVDDNTYLDFVGSWGPLILGHAHEEIVTALEDALRKGTSFGTPTEGEVLLAQKICQMVPSLEKVRLVNSGTEATMSALRLARALTGRSKIVKFAGCYHGHVDSLLVASGSGALTLGIPDSAGVSKALTQDTLVLPFNDLEAVDSCFQKFPQEIAGLIVEPIAGNMGCIPPQNGFLTGLREITKSNGALLIFDEVMTGFRVAAGGAQERFGIFPDITCLGKIIGGGLPVGAYGGSQEIMAQIAPEGPVYQAGTLSGNPLAVTAGLKTLEILQRPGTPGIYEVLEQKSLSFIEKLEKGIQNLELPLTLNHVGSMFSLFFHKPPVTDFATVKESNTDLFGRFFHGLIDAGIYFPPSAFESCFISTAHSHSDLDQAQAKILQVLKDLKSQGHFGQ